MSPTGNWSDQWAHDVGPKVKMIVQAGQQATAKQSDTYITAVLAELGMDAASTTQLNIPNFIGWAGDGRPVTTLLDQTVVKAAKAQYAPALASFKPDERGQAALNEAQRWVDQIAATIMADTARAAESVAIAQRPQISGWVRALDLPSCPRCVILAGRFYRWSDGFARHPGCDCKHIPATEDNKQFATLVTNPNTYFDSLTREQQDEIFGAADAEAIRLGADISQVVNAHRGMRVAQDGRHITTEGTTSRGLAGQRLGNLAKNEGERYRRSRQVRRMPETILNEAKDRDDAIEGLTDEGYIVPSTNNHSPAPQADGSSNNPPRPPEPPMQSNGDDDEYPRTPSGERVPFRPSNRPQLSEADWDRILTKHRHGSAIPGKTTFPANWTDADIRASVDEALARPDSVDRGGDKFIFTKRVRGELVLVQVRVDVDPPIVWTAYPPEGTVAT